VPERNVGCFAGWPSANDWFGGLEHHPFVPPERRGMAVQHCCTGNGARVLYYVWENILSASGGKLLVNLLFNRASVWADVDSHIPYKGQLDVRVKKDLHLEIRMPEWVKADTLRVTVDGNPRGAGFNGRYASVGSVKAGEIVTVTFPIFERRDRVFIEKKEYVLVRKGNDVVDINPPGRYCPLYQRAHYRVDDTRWRKIVRFVPDNQIVW